jgi:hypothetical protein
LRQAHVRGEQGDIQTTGQGEVQSVIKAHVVAQLPRLCGERTGVRVAMNDQRPGNTQRRLGLLAVDPRICIVAIALL